MLCLHITASVLHYPAAAMSVCRWNRTPELKQLLRMCGQNSTLLCVSQHTSKQWARLMYEFWHARMWIHDMYDTCTVHFYLNCILCPISTSSVVWSVGFTACVGNPVCASMGARDACKAAQACKAWCGALFDMQATRLGVTCMTCLMLISVLEVKWEFNGIIGRDCNVW